MVILGEVLVAGGSALVVCSAIFWAWSAIKQKLGDFSAYQHHTIISRYGFESVVTCRSTKGERHGQTRAKGQPRVKEA
jgi:hypothetical protein